MVLLLGISTLATATEKSVVFSVSDGGNEQELTVGVHPNGQSGFVQGLDQLAPPPPPTGAFDARIIVGNESYFTKLLDNTPGEKRYEFLYRSASGNAPVQIFWDESDLFSGATFRIEDRFGGEVFSSYLMELDTGFTPEDLHPILNNGFVLIILYETSTSVQEPIGQPNNFVLHQNYPNPFNPITNIPFELQQAMFVTISVFTLDGRKVKVLFSGYKNEGFHVINFNASNLATGLYVVNLRSASISDSIKMNLIK